MSDSRLLHSVQRLASALTRLERQAAARGGVSVSQLRTLLQLEHAGETGLCVHDLAEEQALAASTMTRNLAVLERKGWVARASGSDDRRTVRVTLTTLGRDTAARLQDTTLGRFSAAFRAFHPADRLERAAALDKVAAALEQAGEVDGAE